MHSYLLIRLRTDDVSQPTFSQTQFVADQQKCCDHSLRKRPASFALFSACEFVSAHSWLWSSAAPKSSQRNFFNTSSASRLCFSLTSATSACRDSAGLKERIGFSSAFSPRRVFQHQIFIPSSFLTVSFFLCFLSIMYRVSQGVITPGRSDSPKFQMSSRETERQRQEATKLVCETIASKKRWFYFVACVFYWLENVLLSLGRVSWDDVIST